MTAAPRDAEHSTDVLIRKVDGHLTAVRPGLRGADLDLAERLAACLREIVTATAQSSAADRARVRAAVHYFVFRRENRGQFLPMGSLAAAQRMVNRTVRQLGRPDLVVLSADDQDAGRPGGDVTAM
jgi:hypothetical protein